MIRNPFVLFWKQDSERQKKFITYTIWSIFLFSFLLLTYSTISQTITEKEAVEEFQSKQEALIISLFKIKTDKDIINSQNELRAATELGYKEIELWFPKFFNETLGVSKTLSFRNIVGALSSTDRGQCYNKAEYTLVLASEAISINAFSGVINTYISLFVDNVAEVSYLGGGTWKFIVANYKEGF